MNLRQFLVAGLTIVSLGGISLTAHAEPGRVTLGDLNADGFVDAIDASMTLAAYANISTEKDSGLNDEQYEAADANYDGFVDAVDASLMLSYYAYVSTGGEKSFGDYLSDPPTSTTATTTALTTPQTTTTTSEPVTTTQAQHYDYTLSNITQSTDVFNYYAKKLNTNILWGASMQVDDCDGNLYWMNGNKEAKVALLLLNESQSYKSGVLSNAFSGYSDYDIKNGIRYFYQCAQAEYSVQNEIDYNDYVLDPTIANYMNQLKDAAKIARQNGDYNELNNILGGFLYEEEYQFARDNVCTCLFTIGYGGVYHLSDYFQDYAAYRYENMEWLVNEYTDIVKTLVK